MLLPKFQVGYKTARYQKLWSVKRIEIVEKVDLKGAMVNLPEPSRQDARAMGERGSDRVQQPRNHHNWGMRSGRRRSEFRNVEPTGLLELEQLAHRTVALMEKHGTKSTSNFQKAMELLRLQYNLNFIVLCERCRGPHVNDEMLAPER